MRKILIYSGPGVGPLSLQNARKIFLQLVAGDYAIVDATAETIKDTAWIATTDLLVMPGGADIPYMQHLSGQGNANIRRFLYNGGRYLGICAGAYFAANFIEFAKGDSTLQVTGERELKFFPGLVTGPTFGGYSQHARYTSGMRATKLAWQHESKFERDREFTVYYNGGGSFVDPHRYDNVRVLANYVPDSPVPNFHPAAIVECIYGDGKAILSGAHFEFDPCTIEPDLCKLPKLRDLFCEEVELSRLALARHLFERLGIDCLKPATSLGPKSAALRAAIG